MIAFAKPSDYCFTFLLLLAFGLFLSIVRDNGSVLVKFPTAAGSLAQKSAGGHHQAAYRCASSRSAYHYGAKIASLKIEFKSCITSTIVLLATIIGLSRMISFRASFS